MMDSYSRALFLCRQLRRVEYPPLADYVDALFHQQNGDSSQMDMYWAKVQAVKDKYPKPVKEAT
jgi:hypothetical protein